MVFADLFRDILYSYETFGKLLPQQRRILSRVVSGRVVHDLGAGNCLLSKKLLNMGAVKVHAVDWRLPPKTPHDDGLVYHQCNFDQYRKKMDVAVLSWPINDDSVDFVRLLERARVIAYLGATTGGTYCGNTRMWKWLVTRKLVHYVPDTKNSLLIYENEAVDRSPVIDEQGGMDIDEIFYLTPPGVQP